MTNNQIEPIIDFSKYVTERTQNFTGREWVFQAINDWLSDPRARRFFLITGDPGSGKTAIAARLYQLSLGEDNGLISPTLTTVKPAFLSAAYFCTARDSWSTDPRAFTESLASQLASKHPIYKEVLTEKVSEGQQIQINVKLENVQAQNVAGVIVKISGDFTETAFNHLIREPLEAMYQENKSENVVILVDALDEALTYGGKVNILSLLARLDDLPAGVRFIVTSRRVAEVESKFLQTARMLFISDSRFDRSNYEDISRYIRKRFSSENSLASKIAGVEPQQMDKITRKIGTKAEGNFLYLRFLIDTISKGQQELTQLDKLPTGLDNLYHDFLARMTTAVEWSREYAPLVGILSVAQESLTESQLQNFAGLSERIVSSHLDMLQQFIEVAKPISESNAEEDTEHHRYKLYHQSFVDFLRRKFLTTSQKEGNDIRNTYYLPADEWHKTIADYYYAGSEVNSTATNENPYSSFDDYGLRYLPFHLAGARKTTQLLELMNDDFGEALRARTHSNLLFTSHLRLAQRVAFELGKRGLAGALRLMLMEIGLRVIADSISPSILALMTHVGHTTRALDQIELIQDSEQKAVSIVLVLQALAKQNVSPALVERASHIAEASSYVSQTGILVLEALAGLYHVVDHKYNAIRALDRAQYIAARHLASSIRESYLAIIAHKYVKVRALDKALQTTALDRAGVRAMPAVLTIARAAHEAEDLQLVREAIKRGVDITGGPFGHHGLDATDIFDLAAIAKESGLDDLYDLLVERGNQVAKEMPGARGLAAMAVHAFRERDHELSNKIIQQAAQKAAKESITTFRAEAWFEILHAAHLIGNQTLSDEALAECLKSLEQEEYHYQVAPLLTKLANFQAKIGFPERGVEIIQRILNKKQLPDSSDIGYEGWMRLILLQAELNPNLSQERLEKAQETFQKVSCPSHIIAELGTAFVRADNLSQACRILERLEWLERPSPTDPAKALILNVLAIHSKDIQELKADAQQWDYEASELVSKVSPEVKNDPTRLEWVVDKMLPSTTGSSTDLKELIAKPDYSDSEQQELFTEALQEEPSYGNFYGAELGFPGLTATRKLVHAATHFAAQGDFSTSLEIIRKVQYGRILSYIQVSPLDALDYGVHDELFNMSRAHAFGLQTIATLAGRNEQVTSQFFDDLLNEAEGIPHVSIRYATMAEIAQSTKSLSEDELLKLSRSLLWMGLSKGREPFLVCLASWIPVLFRLGGAVLLSSLSKNLSLAKRAVEPAYLPEIVSFTPIRGGLRYWD